MSRFIQIHALTFYPPSNANRDDIGRPKTCRVGGEERLRLSSQSLKRAIRTSPAFEAAFGAIGEGLGLRTKELGDEIANAIEAEGVDADEAKKLAGPVADLLGKLKSGKGDNPLHNETLTFLDPQERKRLLDLAKRAAKKDIKKEDLKKETKALKAEIFRSTVTVVDIALFGRMLAADPLYNIEAAAQVAHGFTVDPVMVEDDFFTAVDDLNRGEEDLGAGHLGETGFGSGLFYLYTCVNRDLLEKNLGGDPELAGKAIAAFTEAMAVASPSGKRTGFAHNPYAGSVLIEKGDFQPRSLAGAFQQGLVEDIEGSALNKMLRYKEQLDSGYETPWSSMLFDPLERGQSKTPERATTLRDAAAFAGA